ncbi:MAG: branched-chain amino acid ABC transporter permease [Solirubrobacteraceae bacterium]
MNVAQTIIDGIALGAVYAIVAVGLALVFGVMRMINFAQGELITACAYALALSNSLPTWVAILIALGVGVGLSFLMELVAFRPLRNASSMTTLVATFAIAFMLESVWILVFGPQGKAINTLTSLNESATSGSLHLRWITIVMIIVGIVSLVGLALLLHRTRIGLYMRAAASDFRTARLLGVRANAVISFTFVLGGLSAAIAAILLTVSEPLATPDFGLSVMIVALFGAVAGGIDRLVPATLGAFLFGFVTSVLGDVLPSSASVFLTSFVFALIIVILLVRPGGLFAPFQHRTVERV